VKHEDLPGPIEFAVLAGESRLHAILDRCESQALVRSCRQRGERSYELTHRGRALLRTRQRFALALAALLARSDPRSLCSVRDKL
jgi:hypothetical protein